MNSIKTIFITVSFLLLSLSITSQVTIGLTEKAESGAILQLKNIDKDHVDGLQNATKGLLMPRVLLTEKHSLYPMFSDNIEYYVANKTAIDAEHIGLLVYNTIANTEQILCKGMNVWNGSEWQCLFNPAKYTMDCSSIAIKGVYQINQSLDPTKHYITMDLLSEENAIGALYHIKTNVVDGIYFEAKGILTSEKQTITLKGYGTPIRLSDKKFTITSNSISSKATCSTTVQMVIPSKSILVLGNSVMHGYNISLPNTGSYKLFTSAENFGIEEYSIFKYNRTNFANDSTFNGTSFPQSFGTDINGYEANLRKVLLQDTTKIDIVILTQDVYINSTNIANILTEYVQKKGVLIAFWEANGGASLLMNKLLGTTGITDQPIHSSGAVYQISNAIDDKIVNGPFGDVRGLQWGEDASSTRALYGLNTNDIYIYSTGYDLANKVSNNGIVAFRHKTHNLVFFGDGGFNSSGTDGKPYADPLICPFWWNTTATANMPKYYPIPKPKYGRNSSNSFDVYNSTLFCNTMAWAIYQAEFNGINTPK